MWISVKERLPQDHEDVLVFTSDQDMAVAQYVELDTGLRWFLGSAADLSIDPFGEITHWQPLPEPPVPYVYDD